MAAEGMAKPMGLTNQGSTKDRTKTGLPELGEAGNCAQGLVEATDKLGPGKQKLDVVYKNLVLSTELIM